jgi:hypothetical protein
MQNLFILEQTEWFQEAAIPDFYILLLYPLPSLCSEFRQYRFNRLYQVHAINNTVLIKDHRCRQLIVYF